MLGSMESFIMAFFVRLSDTFDCLGKSGSCSGVLGTELLERLASQRLVLSCCILYDSGY